MGKEYTRKVWQRRDDFQPLTKEYYRNRAIVMRRDRGLCLICELQGQITPATDCDHIVPRSKGGSDALSNLAMLCPNCHSLKTRQEATGSLPDRLLLPVYGLDGWELPTVTRDAYQSEVGRRNALMRENAGF